MTTDFTKHPPSGAARRAVIFSGGELGAWALAEIQPGDRLIGADHGAWFLVENGQTPDLSIGDFDSVSGTELRLIEEASRSMEACDPIDKDYTDTEMAVERALADSPSSITLLGVLGTRFDHSLANVHLLVKCAERGVSCRIVDAHNEVTLVQPGRPLTVTKNRFANVSLLPLTPQVTGITLSGFLYPLEEATLTMGQSLGISNVLNGDEGTVRTAAGLLLIIQSVD
ncbi:thiamine diphosphokinase [Gorillibacterium timonense]|uniref:thiamine diphosphokinase n=1 Tax=Gorillibacterium timonense TaxID=1689269 RepID=UPI00071CEAF5|nr:thiamine diphosphokinase [Gorillibacterium timonense]